MSAKEAQQRAEAIGSLMTDYFQMYLTNPNVNLDDTEAALRALRTCRLLAIETMEMVRSEFVQHVRDELPEHLRVLH